jgi:Fe-S cluster biosynthesis and repair protein YggX
VSDKIVQNNIRIFKKKKVMNEKRIELLIEELRKQIKESDKMFLDGEDKSYIIGWLQGTIKTATMELSSILEEQKRLN